MTHLTSFQRKIAYAVGIGVLLVPIIWLGMPAGRNEAGEPTAPGKLAQLRRDYDLGETSLGNVDPSSSTMNLVLLGFRGVATNLLWQKALDQRDQKQWAELRATTDSIIMLQPHYIKVWDFQGWNLAYNVSAEWDNVPDRFYWVKEGGKFYMRGTDRNARNPDLAFHVGGRILGHKIGRSDEKSFFRGYFLKDPNPKFKGPDPEFNRGYATEKPFTDNYLAAHEWHVEANRREEEFPPQHVMMRELFRSYPARSYLEMANALQTEGVFTAADLPGTGRTLSAADAWRLGRDAWTNGFGREEFPSAVGPVRLEIEPSEYPDIARRNGVTVDQVAREIDFLQNTTNYRYWRDRSAAEAEPQTAQAHRDIFEGEKLFREGKLEQSRELLLKGLRGLEAMFARFPKVEEDDDLATEEALIAHVYLREIYDLSGEALPADLPLQRLWTEASETRLDEIRQLFKLQTQL